MHLAKTSRAFLALFIAVTTTARIFADVVETQSGARIVGKVSKIDAGSVIIETSYAGRLSIKQSEVTAITTDAPVAVRLISGTRTDGRLSGGANGALQVASPEGTINTTVGQLASSWTAGASDPALARDWAYEASADIFGKTGNKEQLGTAFAFRAIMTAPRDTLMFYSAYDRQVSEGTKSADQFKAGIDYQNNFSGRWSWYARDEGGFNRVKGVEMYNVAAVGLGYDFIKEPKHILTGRAGLSYRYEGYKNPRTPDVSSPGLDFGINHEYEFSNSRLVNRLSYVPAIDDLAIYRITHESFFEIPLVAPSWKLRMGVANDYNSQPGFGVDRLDTSYFTRFVLSWK